MEVRAIKPEEINDVLALIDQYDQEAAPRPDQACLETIYTAIIESGGCVVGAFADESLLGTCTINICPNLSWSGRPYAIIENVIVSEHCRGKGIGKAVLCYAKQHFEAAGCYKVALMTGSKKSETHHFYESAGFVASKTGYVIRFNA
ncbi:GNAT family N-acetyltransferase [Aliamphritea ceti]|uniref:GNAT family N-acetyltransferase n=1 Tax=Aliamphritea ceti TaxID=1524258 RepID=UPI0021C40F0F|nr:GNAT family N-acetyltransferase [Aliamphritea ceti]